MNQAQNLFSSKNNLLRCWGCFSLLNCIGVFMSVAKTTFKKIRAFIHLTKFPSPKVALYLYKFTMQSCMECCCHVWAVAPSCYSEMLDKLQKVYTYIYIYIYIYICRTAGASRAASHGSRAHHQNAASISLFYKYCFGRC